MASLAREHRLGRRGGMFVLIAIFAGVAALTVASIVYLLAPRWPETPGIL